MASHFALKISLTNLTVIMLLSVGACGHEQDQKAVVRLVGGGSSSEGRVVVRQHYFWGTVCDDRWDDMDARVVCRSLGFGSGQAKREAFFGPGFGPILLNQVACSGEETSLLNCGFSLRTDRCGHDKDASVVCSSHPLVRTSILNSSSSASRAHIFFQSLLTASVTSESNDGQLHGGKGSSVWNFTNVSDSAFSELAIVKYKHPGELTKHDNRKFPRRKVTLDKTKGNFKSSKPLNHNQTNSFGSVSERKLSNKTYSKRKRADQFRRHSRVVVDVPIAKHSSEKDEEGAWFAKDLIKHPAKALESPATYQPREDSRLDNLKHNEADGNNKRIWGSYSNNRFSRVLLHYRFKRSNRRLLKDKDTTTTDVTLETGDSSEDLSTVDTMIIIAVGSFIGTVIWIVGCYLFYKYIRKIKKKRFTKNVPGLKSTPSKSILKTQSAYEINVENVGSTSSLGEHGIEVARRSKGSSITTMSKSSKSSVTDDNDSTGSDENIPSALLLTEATP